jgi:hypothetical protein
MVTTTTTNTMMPGVVPNTMPPSASQLGVGVSVCEPALEIQLETAGVILANLPGQNGSSMFERVMSAAQVSKIEWSNIIRKVHVDRTSVKLEH